MDLEQFITKKKERLLGVDDSIDEYIDNKKAFYRIKEEIREVFEQAIREAWEEGRKSIKYCDDCGDILPKGYSHECPDCELKSYNRAIGLED